MVIYFQQPSDNNQTTSSSKINMTAFSFLLTLSTAVTVSLGHVAVTKTPNELHPVHELYVKPSADGTTGDLYVAATEESGSKSQWLTDQPVHFLSAQPQPALPKSYAEESLNTKRAVVNPYMQYAYAMSGAGKPDTGALATYPYALPTSSPSPAAETKTEAATTAATAVPQYNPYQFFYPQIMAAYTNMMNVLKETGMSEESATAVLSQSSSMWPQSYAYPVQYVMVDPSMWAQAQASASATSTPSAPVAADEE
ncbi:unnamed protein product [Diatraea saccharalis]|uniref:Uncharacterized protein n=1 Tax=Diatraea saccharalis TaxID=40085 RepID=A0A9N9QUZ1_9NEOP|nr:unnamed protein product [Diatraea saccharalis]